jgi:hypothetical protein
MMSWIASLIRGKASPYKVKDDAVVAEARRLLAVVCRRSKERCHVLSALMITSVSKFVDDERRWMLW